MRIFDGLEKIIGALSVGTAWLTVVPIAILTGLQMLDRKLHLGVSSYLPDFSTSLLFILIYVTFGFTYLRDGHVRVDLFRRNWPPRRLAWIELGGCLLVVLPLATILTYYGWDGLMRTTQFADTDIWARRIAAVIGPVVLGLAGLIVIARNVVFLRGNRNNLSPLSEEDLPRGD
ncbi:TRAP transporter small permease subunit [Maritalea mobilis]|uniref:TRAP transporter small permease subunit n=1 Tax=Maritalea mobilis TaxID=483324 RepID=UPI001C9511FB|nr:TRAP transporter small permease subunit [Maritalea mobilis]MBY6203202.1 TRAP transporter small permease subunit [Maritalea mobilis]